MYEGTFKDELKRQYQYGGMHIRLIIVNVAVFLAIALLHFIAKAGNIPMLEYLTNSVFTMQRSFGDFIYEPWGIFTSIFAHASFLHLLMNMLFLFFFGQIFLQFFSGRRLLIVYILGGIFGNLAELLFSLIPAFSGSGSVLGASGAVMAIVAAIAFYRPRLQVNLFGVFPLPIFVFAIILFIADFINLGSQDSVAHAAHLGGAVLGLLAVNNLHSSSNIVNATESLFQFITRSFSGLYKPSSRLKVERGGRTRKSDEEYNMEAKARQAKTDKILDKISKSGYDSLTRAEKDFLFTQSKK